MPNVTVNFEVTAANGTSAFWIAVDDQDVPLIDGKGPASVSDDRSHSLVWWFTGNPGGTLSVTGKVGEKKVVEVKDDKIPANKIYGGGFKDFVVT